MAQQVEVVRVQGNDDDDKKTPAQQQHEYSLSDLFMGRQQLIVYHAMFDQEWDAACASCSVLLASMNELRHLNSRGVTLVAVSRASADKIAAYRQRLDFNFPWLSSEGADFNADYAVSVNAATQPMYNFRSVSENEDRGMPWFTKGEQPGHSVFIKGDGDAGIGETSKIYHTYSQYARGGESVIPTFAWLDMTLLGRQDGMSDQPGLGFRRTDEYSKDELEGVWKDK